MITQTKTLHPSLFTSLSLLTALSSACLIEAPADEGEEPIDDDSIDDDSIGAQDIATSENSTPVGLSNATLVGRWTLDGSITDSVGSNDGATFGNTSYVVGVGKQGQALRINAQGGYAAVDSIVDDFGTGDFSVSVWVNYHGLFAGHARHEHVFTDGWVAGVRKLDLFAERAGGSYYWWIGTQVATLATAPWISAKNQWHHVVMGREGYTRFLCIDGQLHGQSHGAPVDMTNNDSFYLGRNPYQNGGRSLPGALDELRAYDGWIGVDGCAALYTDPHGICGDGVTTASEECDDGNDDNDDGCLDTCLLDNDMDGSPASEDCNDNDSNAYPDQNGVCPLGQTCKAILDSGAGAGDGLYLIDPDGIDVGQAPLEVWCDMLEGGVTAALIINTVNVGTDIGDFGSGYVSTNLLGVDPATTSSPMATAVQAWLDLNAYPYTQIRLAAYSDGAGTYTSEWIDAGDLRIAFGQDGYLLWDSPDGYYWCGGAASYTDGGMGQVNQPMGAPAGCKGHGTLGSGWDFSHSNFHNEGLTMCGGDASAWMYRNYGSGLLDYPNPGAAYVIWAR
jgi:cysteine-rich repeat protein